MDGQDFRIRERSLEKRSRNLGHDGRGQVYASRSVFHILFIPQPDKLQTILLLAWAYSTFPPLIQLMEAGRSVRLALDSPVEPTALSGQASTVISSLLIIVCALQVIESLQRVRLLSAWLLILYLTPWVCLEIINGLASGSSYGRQVIAFPLIALAFWTGVPNKQNLFRLAGWLTVATASISVGLGIFAPTLGEYPYVPLPGLDKALIGQGTLLAGPYTHPNALGLVLTLGLPGVLLIRSPLVRLLAVSVVGYAIAWSAARTSIVAAVAVLVTAIGLHYIQLWFEPKWKSLVGSSLVAAIFLIGVVIPLTTRNPADFSNRGQMWLASLDAWPKSPWLGRGPDYYELQLGYANAMGSSAAHGHNLFINTLTVGGIVGVVAMYLFLAGVLVQARLDPETLQVPVLYLLSLAVVGCLEVTFNFSNIGAYGWAVWLPLATIVFGYVSPAQNEPDTCAQK